MTFNFPGLLFEDEEQKEYIMNLLLLNEGDSKNIEASALLNINWVGNDGVSLVLNKKDCLKLSKALKHMAEDILS